MDNGYGYDSWAKNPFLADDTPTQPIDNIMQSRQEDGPDENSTTYKVGYALGAAFASLLMITGILLVFIVFCLGLSWLLS